MCLRGCCAVWSHLEPAVIFCPSCAFADRQSSNASLETLLALLQTEGAKIEEDTEVMTQHPNSATSTHCQNLPDAMAAVLSWSLRSSSKNMILSLLWISGNRYLIPGILFIFYLSNFVLLTSLKFKRESAPFQKRWANPFSSLVLPSNL